MTASIHYLPPRHDEGERLGDAWRIKRADLAENMLWIREYGRALAHAAMTPTYRRHIERAHASQCRSYRETMREVHQIEQALDAAGIEFNRSN